jgi:hypothetical protein
VFEVAISELPLALLVARCKDQSVGAANDGGEVWQVLKDGVDAYGTESAYLSMLNGINLWAKMDAKIDSLRGCPVVTKL